MGEASYRIVSAADNYKGIESVSPAGFLRNMQPVNIGDITVTPFLCDHSAFDSYMLLCEANGERILYTGDFRSNGRKSFDALLKRLPEKVDKLICEGTTLSRENYVTISEKELEEQAVKLFQEKYGLEVTGRLDINTQIELDNLTRDIKTTVDRQYAKALEILSD